MAEIDVVGVVGSGMMGAGLVEVAATAGYHVVARSRSTDRADALVTTVAARLDRQVSKGTISAAERDDAMARITPTAQLGALADCDLVIESIVEDLVTKRELFTEIGQVAKSTAILATNT